MTPPLHHCHAPPPPPSLLFCPFLSFAKPTVNIKLPKPQSEESSGGKSTFLKHMHFQFLFCSIIKSSICTAHRGSLCMLLVPQVPPDRHILTEHHKIDQIHLFSLLLQDRQQPGPSNTYTDNTLLSSKQMHQLEFS